MHRLRRHLSYANVAATLALIIAVAGGGTALAVAIHSSKKSDINKKGNIRVGRVTAKKLANGNVTAAKLAGIDVVQGSDTTTGGLADLPARRAAALRRRRADRVLQRRTHGVSARWKRLAGPQKRRLGAEGLRPLPEGVALAAAPSRSRGRIRGRRRRASAPATS